MPAVPQYLHCDIYLLKTFYNPINSTFLTNPFHSLLSISYESICSLNLIRDFTGNFNLKHVTLPCTTFWSSCAEILWNTVGLFSEPDFMKFCGFWLSLGCPQGHLSRADGPLLLLCRAHTELKPTPAKQGFRGDDLPSALGGMNPRMEGNLDSTGAGRESNRRIRKLEKTLKTIKSNLWPKTSHPLSPIGTATSAWF